MTSRIKASLAALGLFSVLVVAAVAAPVPFVVYRPGPTFDVLGESDGEEIITVDGHPVYRDDGQLRFTTVSLTNPAQELNVFDVLAAWFSGSDAVYPREAVYPEGQTAAEAEQRSSLLMVSSQDAAIANAIRAAGDPVPEAVEVREIVPDSGADGALKVGDELLRVGITRVESSEDVVAAVDRAAPGDSLDVQLRRDGATSTVQVRLKASPDDASQAQLGVSLAPGYSFPYEVDLAVSDSVGGSSAGLMFSLAVYDTLTEGSLTGGRVVAGTGTITDDGSVGPIGGIAQKIVGAGRSGAKLFFVPADNCAAASTAEVAPGMRLVRAVSFDQALDSLKKWADDPRTELPTCP